MTRRADLFPFLILAVGMLAFVAACFVVQPVGVTITDEVHYYIEAQALWRQLPLSNPASYLLDTGQSPFPGPLYPTGWPLLLAPFTALPWPWAFSLAPLIHLLGTTAMAALFRRRGLSPAWALLYLAQPTLLAFSRTLMAEPLAVFQTALIMLIADCENPLLLGLVAGFSPLIKLSQVIIVAPFVAVWLWRRPQAVRARAVLQAALGSTLGVAAFLWFNHATYGRWLASGYSPAYATPGLIFPWLGLGLAQLAFAWPLLPAGLLKSRLPEAAGVIAAFLYLALYGYHYRSASLAATLVVGARLHSSAIVLLLPGYAALLTSHGKALRTWALGALTAAALVMPFLILRAVSQRRAELQGMRDRVLDSLRPGCLLGYSKSSFKLLLPLPAGKTLHSPGDVAQLEHYVQRGVCVDLVDPLAEPSTYDHPPTYPDDFEPLLEAWPHRDHSPSADLRVFWLDAKPQ